MSNRNEKKSKRGVVDQARSVGAKMLRFFRIRPVAGGLEVTDQLLRLAYFDGSAWQFRAVRMEPGIVEGGKIIDPAAFSGALLSLRGQVPKLAKKSATMNVVVSLGAATIYNQIFNLPLLRGEELMTAMKLNLQMASSVDVSQVYSGFEVISTNESTGRIEALGAFADRAMVDAVTGALFSAGFIATAIESKALSVARTVKQYCPSLDPEKSYLVVIIDDTGLDFIIVRRGKLCFEYMEPWRDMTNDKGEISSEKFRQSFALDLRQVMNFYQQHWTDKIAAVGLSGEFFTDEAREIIAAVEPVDVVSMKNVLGDSATDAWVAPFGAGLRGMAIEETVHEIDFLGEGARRFSEESRILDFLSFWRVAAPIFFAALIAVLGVSDAFIRTTGTSTASYSASITSENAMTAQKAAGLISQATAFNNSVAMISSLEAAAPSRSALLGAISAAAASSSITLTRVALQSEGTPILIAGQAQSEDSISAFKTAISATPGFTSVDLPLQGIQGSGTQYTFSMTFSAK